MSNHNGNLPPFASDRTGATSKSRAKLVLEHFNAMATAEERKFLMDRGGDSGKKEQLVRALHDLVLSRLVQAYKAAGVSLAKPLRKKAGCSFKLLPAGSLEGLLAKLPQGKRMVADSTLCAAFRAKAAAKMASSGSANASILDRPAAKRQRTSPRRCSGPRSLHGAGSATARTVVDQGQRGDEAPGQI